MDSLEITRLQRENPWTHLGLSKDHLRDSPRLQSEAPTFARHHHRQLRCRHFGGIRDDATTKEWTRHHFRSAGSTSFKRDRTSERGVTKC